MRRIIRYLLYVALVLFVITLSGYFYVFQFGGLENIVNNKLSSLVDGKYLLDIDIKEINGSYVSGFVLEDIDIYYNDSLNRYRLVRIPKLKTAYSFSNLWNKKFMLDFLIIDSAEITLIRDSANNWIIPDFRPKKNSTSMFKLPSFSIGAFDIRNMSVTLLDKGDSVSFNNIFLSLELKGEEKTYAFDIEKFQFSSNQDDILLNTAGGQITFDDSNLLFKNVALITGETRLKLDGNINLVEKPNGLVEFAIDNLDLSKIARYIGPKLKGIVDLNGKVQFSKSEISGSATIGGRIAIVDIQNALVDFSYKDKILSLDTLIGTVFGECDIVGSGYIDFRQPLKSYYLSADVKQFNLKSMIKNSFSSNLSGSLIMNGSGFKKDNFQLNFDADLLESQFDEYPIHAASGHFEVNGDSIHFFEPFLIDYFENVFSVDGYISYRDEMELRVTADLKNLDRYQQKLFIDQPGGRGFSEFVLDGETVDPNLKGYFISDSVWIYGLYADSLYATIDIDQFLHAKQGYVEVGFSDGFAWSVPYDSGYTYLSIDSNLVHIEKSSLSNQFTKIATNGRFDYEAVPNLLTLDSLYLDLARQSFYNRDKIIVEVDSLGFAFKQASIGFVDQWLAVNGRTNFDESFDLLFSINHIPIKPWKNLYEDSLSLDGVLSCEAALQGSFKNPEFVIRGQIDSLAYQELILGDLNTVLSYKNNKLTIDSVVVFSNPGKYRAEGFMYIDLEFTSGDINRFPNYPMDIQCNATDSRFDLVSHFLPSVEDIDGNFFADFILSGTPNKPHLQGEAYIKSYYGGEKNELLPARLKYFDLEAPIYTDSAGVTMFDNKIQIDGIDVYGYDKKRKRHSIISGDITVKTFDNLYYNLEISISEPMPFVYELDDIRGKAQGVMFVKGDTPPLVSGNLEITEMKYDVNFAEIDQGSPIMLALEGENSWDLDLDIEMLANYWIRNEDISAEFAGEIKLKRTAGLYSFAGEMEILHGNGYLFDKVIRLDPGGLVIFQGDDKFDPVLDITGYTTISGTRDNLDDENTSEQLRLGLLITGTLEEPEINVTDDSDFESNEEILPLLVGNLGGGNSTVSSSYVERVAGLLATQVSQIGTRHLQAIGVETFEVDAQYTAGQIDPSKSRVTLGGYIAPKFYTYGRFGTNRREIGVEYRLSKSLLMQGLSDEDGFYHLNLKFNKEFD